MSAVTGKCSQVQASWEQHGGRGSMKSMQMLSSSRYELEDLEAVCGVLVYKVDITEDDTQNSL